MLPLSPEILRSFPGFAKSPFQPNSICYIGPDVYATSVLLVAVSIGLCHSGSLHSSFIIYLLPQHNLACARVFYTGLKHLILPI